LLPPHGVPDILLSSLELCGPISQWCGFSRFQH
jgi:hypothetical protein